jgi:flagellar basal body-associated protein FliL
VAKSSRGSLWVRIVMGIVALALAAVAARLWLDAKPLRELSAAERARAESAAAADDAASAPPTHGEIAPEDRERMRELLRDAEAETP